MTVKDLKDKLNTMNDDLEVVFFIENVGDTANYMLINNANNDDEYCVLEN